MYLIEALKQIVEETAGFEGWDSKSAHILRTKYGFTSLPKQELIDAATVPGIDWGNITAKYHRGRITVGNAPYMVPNYGDDEWPQVKGLPSVRIIGVEYSLVEKRVRWDALFKKLDDLGDQKVKAGQIWFAQQLPIFDKLGMESIAMQASFVGAYTWTRFGFSPGPLMVRSAYQRCKKIVPWLPDDAPTHLAKIAAIRIPTEDMKVTLETEASRGTGEASNAKSTIEKWNLLSDPAFLFPGDLFKFGKFFLIYVLKEWPCNMDIREGSEGRKIIEGVVASAPVKQEETQEQEALFDKALSGAGGGAWIRPMRMPDWYRERTGQPKKMAASKDKR